MSITTATVQTELQLQARAVESFLGDCLADLQTPPRLREAMNYSLLAGGKRLRPVLCLSTAALFGVPAEHAMPFAAALEMIHTYSLIHDDLPCMDDDDLRRGRPTNHKAFDEATALLAGDALLTDAFWFMTRAGEHLAQDRVLAAVREAALATGSSGMVGGQMLDIALTGHDGATLDALRQVHVLKTGALLRAACTCGALLGGAREQALEAIARYGVSLGLAFQIVDDILDVIGEAEVLGKTPGSDAARGKATYPALIGLEESRKLAALASDDAVQALGGFAGPQAEFLTGLARLLVERTA